MNFLNPWLLLAGLAALIPIIIHLLHRQRARIEVFPSLEFLRRMMRKRTRRFRIKQILLLVVRALLLLLVALALARPSLTRGRAVRGHLPTTAVVVLDDSFSMARRADGGTLFDLALDRARTVLSCFGQTDDVHLLTASAPGRDLSEEWATRDPARLRERLGEVSVTSLATDLRGPLEAALGVLAASPNPNREIYVISDMQRVGWEVGQGGLAGEGAPGAGLPAGGGEAGGRVSGGDRPDADRPGSGAGEKPAGKALVIDLGEPEPNACVAGASLRIPSGSDDLELEVTFQRYNWSDAQGTVAEVFVGGDLLGRSVFSPGEGGRENETFRLPPFKGFLWGEIALAEDRLTVDDKRYFAIPSRQRVVGLVGEAYYVSRALSPEGGGGVSLVEIDEGGISRLALSRLDLLVVSDVARFSPLEVGAIADYLAGGGSLLIFLGGKVDVGDYNRNLLPRVVAAAVPGAGGAEGEVRIEGTSAGSAGGSTGRSFFSIERFDRSHRMFGKFRPEESPFGDARFYTFMKIRADAGRALAYFSDGSPALVELGERTMIFAGPADVSWNDLVLAPQFVPLLHEAILALTSGATLGEDHRTGSDVLLKGGERGGEVILDGPAGSVRLFPEAVGAGARYRVESPSEPGVYFLRDGEETLTVFAVNVDQRESDLTKAAAEDVAAALAPLEVRPMEAADDVVESVSMMRRGRDLSRALLWAALGLLLVETLLASTLPLRVSRTEGQDALADS